MSEGEEAETELSQTSCPAYEELLEVMERATARLHLPWERTKMAAPPGRLDERYLSGHKPPAQVSLPFLPDLHTEVEREWKKPFSSRIHRFQHTSYANIARMRESGYERMPPVEETLASYLSMGDTASLKVPSLPFKSLQDTSRLNGRAYAAAGQAVALLHTMAVLQAYQADLLKDLDDGQGLSPDEVAELRRTTDLALRATKQAATAMGRSMAAMVVMERHLWVNLADLEKKEKGFLLDAPVSPSELFGTSVETGPMMTFGTGSSKLPYWWSGPEVSSEVSWNLLGLQVILVCKSLGNPNRSLSGPLHATVGRASIAPLALEGHLWACRSLLSV